MTRSYRVDGGAASARYVAPTVDGAHSVVVTDTDAAGNSASATLDFTLDQAPPSVLITSSVAVPGPGQARRCRWPPPPWCAAAAPGLPRR